VRGIIRGVYDGRYKFARYFKISEHHEPRDWSTLTAHNDLELYDTQADPDEIVNSRSLTPRKDST
jgi:arylsulfatase